MIGGQTEPLKASRISVSLCCAIALLASAGCSAFQNGRDTLFGSDEIRDPEGKPVVFDAADDPNRPIELSDLAPDKIGKTVNRAIGRGPDQEYARQKYAEAEKLFESATQSRIRNPNGNHQPDFVAAAKLYREAADRWPDSALEQDALFRAGEAYFFGDSYPKAEESYALLIKKHENSKYIDSVMSRRFQIAEYWHEANRYSPHYFLAYNFLDETRPGLDTGGHALRVWDRIRIDDPTGKLADDAIMAAGNAHFAGGEFMRADEFYSDLRKTFPSSEFQFDAHYLGLQAKLRSYQGPQYSGKPLVESEKLLKQIRKQFPRESQQHQEFLDRAYREVRYKQAEREWLRGQFYDRRAEYRAARLYYDTLLSDYDDTPFADKAKQRIAEIADKPPTPPQRLSWLVAMFPAKQEVKPLIKSDSISTVRR